jgi:membrane-associated phospholipid phosphatase
MKGQRHLISIIILIPAIIVGILTAAIGDIYLFTQVNQSFGPEWKYPALAFSFLGEAFTMVLLLLLTLKQPFRQTLLVGLVWLSGACYSWMFKLGWMKGAPRPLEYFSRKGIGIETFTGVKVHHFNTFPSGHTLTVFSAVVLVDLLFPKASFPIKSGVLVLALGCAFSRMVLAQHWASDLAGGMLLGLFAGYTGYWIVLQLPRKPLLELSIWEQVVRREKA